MASGEQFEEENIQTKGSQYLKARGRVECTGDLDSAVKG